MEEAKKKGLNGKDIAQLLGLKKSPLTDWKNEKSMPTTEQIIELCEIFAISADYLLFGLANENLTNEEITLLSKFKELSNADKQEILNIVDYKIFKAKEKEEKSFFSGNKKTHKVV